MAEYDLVIRGGTIVEGTGIPRYRGDLAVKNGRIAKISGNIKAAGAKEVDARGCYVAPGAVDLHTHYDAQLNWDPYASLSGWFGVTSLTIGLCGFGFAPTKPEDRERAMLLMNRVEAIPLSSMKQGMRWDWVTYPEYLDSLDRQGLGLNVASLFPVNPLRSYVMGTQAAREKTSATEAELNEMKRLFHEGMKAGSFGFSGNESLEDRNEEGGPLPTHLVSREEWIGLAEVLGEFGIGHIGASFGQHDPNQSRELYMEMLKISGRPMNILVQAEHDTVVWMDEARAEGLGAVAQQAVMPPWAEFSLAEYNLLDYMDSWVQPLVGTPQERMVKLKDPATRAAMQADVDARPGRTNTDYDIVWVLETFRDRNHKYQGMTISELAKAVNKKPLDAWLDLAIDEDLETVFRHLVGERPIEETERLIKSPYTHISVSDGGAHVRYLTIATWPIYFLSHWVRDKEVMSLEQAAYKMSAYPAWLAGMKERGMLRIGSWADIIVYDLDNLGLMYDPKRDGYVFANDFPGGERRIIQKPTGLRYTIVNGTVTFEDTECSGALPGKLLRSYDMVD